MILSPDSLLLDLATNAPGALRVLEDAGIDYYCAGRRTLAEGCERAGVEVDAVIPRLAAAAATTKWSQHPDWDNRPILTVVAHIAERHHEVEREQLARLRELFTSATLAGSDDGRALEAIEDALNALDAVLREHVAGTTAALFSHVIALEAGAGAPTLGAPFAARLIHRLRTDHESVRALLESIRQHTHRYAPPAGASQTVCDLYAGLAAWERGAHEHAHLENNVLVSRILTLDPSMERDATPVGLPTRHRQILSSNGRSQEHTVFCPAERQSIDLEWCRACPFARRVTETSVECTPKVDPPAVLERCPRIGERVAVGEAMSEHYTSVGPEVPAGVVADALEAEHTGAAVLVDDGDRLVGTVRRDHAQDAHPDLTANDLSLSTPYIDESRSLADAIDCMVKTHSRFLPVVGPKGRVVGILADTDALRWVAAVKARAKRP